MSLNYKKFSLKNICIIYISCFSFAFGEVTVDINVAHQTGRSLYEVNNANATNYLQSKLDFPIVSNLYGLSFGYHNGNFELLGGAHKQFNSIGTDDGEDWDWQNQTLTLYSHSNNTIEKNQKYFIEYSYIPTIIDTKLSIRHERSEIDFTWKNTTQTNYINQSTTNFSSNTLTYAQKIKKIVFTPLQNSNKHMLIYKLSLNYYEIDSIDHHLLRNLVVNMNNKGFGYQYEIGMKVPLSNQFSFKAVYQREKFKDNAPMRYYQNGYYVNSFPASLTFDLTSLLFGFTYIY